MRDGSPGANVASECDENYCRSALEQMQNNINPGEPVKVKVKKILTILKVQTILTSAAFSEPVKGENFGGFVTCTNCFTNRIVWRTKINWSSQGIVRHPPHQTSTKLGNPPYWTSTRHPPRQTSTAPDIHHTRQSTHRV